MDVADDFAAPAERRPGAPSLIFAIIAALAAAFFYWVAQSSIAGFGQSDPAGNVGSPGTELEFAL